MKQVSIIGAGPAGVSAALYTVRAGIDTTVFYTGFGALGKAEKIENYYGFSSPISGEALARQGMEGAARLGVRFRKEEVLGLSFTDKLTLLTKEGSYPSDAVILATGSSRLAPPLPGIKELEGSGISYCAVCDAFFYRGKRVGVLGSGPYAAHEAEVLRAVAGSVTILTNGQPFTGELPQGVSVDLSPIQAVEGSDAVAGVRFRDGGFLALDGLFVAVGVAGSAAFARKIGAVTEGDRIVTDEAMATNVPGLFAAGDCVGGLLQIAKAVSDGAKAGLSAVRYLQGK